jgi:transposase
MPLRKPRSKKTFLAILKDLKFSRAVKNALADISVEFDLIVYDSMKELRLDILATLHQVEAELYEHDREYHHTTSPEVKEAVRKAILKLGGKPKQGATR